MLKVLLVGATGAMGHKVSELIRNQTDVQITAGITHEMSTDYPFPLYTDFEDIAEAYDVVIDFSHPNMVDRLLDHLETQATPAVICTTGLSDEQGERIETLAETVPLFRSGNMSLGIHVLTDLIRRAKVLLPGFDVEIIEKHHRRKVDAPSGTAKMLADALDPDRAHRVHGREGIDTRRKDGEIGIHAVRGGTIVGEHDVLFAGESETIQLSHVAESKGVFASGALEAARFLATQAPGLYDMTHLMKNKENKHVL